MSTRKSKEVFEAIFFFGKKSIIKEMRYSEFEAVLDGVVGLTTFAKKQVSAAYLKIDSQLKVRSVVTFQIEFDELGFADEDWNIPLRHIAENSGPGPDLGGGAIRLACRSQCSVSWYQRELWEPNSKEINHFKLIKEAVSRNKLGLIVPDLEDDIPLMEASLADVDHSNNDIPTVSDKVSSQNYDGVAEEVLHEKLEQQTAQFQKKMELLVERQKQTIINLEEKYRQEIDQVKRAMRNETQSYRRQSQDLEQQANHSKVLLEKLQAQNVKLQREVIQAEEMAESQKDQYRQLKDEYLELLRNQRSNENEKSLQIVELKELVMEKAVDLDELTEEIKSLKLENARLQEASTAGNDNSSPTSDENLSQVGTLNRRMSQIQHELDSSTSELSKVKAEYRRLKDTHQELRDQLHSATEEAGQLRVEKQRLEQELKQVEFRVQDVEQSLIKALQGNEDLAKELAEFEETEEASASIFKKLEDLELVFVAYHPGAGHISLPARQLEDYLEKPIAIAAQKCAVTLAQYKSWLVHYDNSECEECGEPIKRVDTPSDFKSGISDRCSRHRVLGDNISMFRKSS